MVFRIQFVPLQEGLSRQKMIEFSNEVAANHAQAIAEEVKDTFENWLSRNPKPGPLGTYPIGASGKSSKNFFVEEKKTKKGVSTYYVRETGAPANVFIRKGIPPGTRVTLQALKLWLARKGFDVLSSSDYKKKMGLRDAFASDKWTYGKAQKIAGYSSTSKKGNTFNVKEHGRSEAGAKNIVNSALMAIRNVLIEEGTERPNANWVSYFPKERGRFDYPTYLVVQRRVKMDRILQRHSNSTAFAMVSFWNSNGQVKIWDWNLGRVRRSNPRGLFF